MVKEMFWKAKMEGNFVYKGAKLHRFMMQVYRRLFSKKKVDNKSIEALRLLLLAKACK